ncbi:MAG: DUF1538 domain-containing protein [Clostridiales bacterium]|jgi:hypothetical protein|nr:DUF1538 domain-containing protein [Clostridiales bacterium]
MGKTILAKLKESVVSVLPVTVLVIIVALTLVGVGGAAHQIEPGYMLMFCIGAALLIVGMSFFTLGADVAMMPMGQSVGNFLSGVKRKRFPFVLLAAFLIGALVTIAEPDLLVLATQLGGGAVNVFIWLSVAAGVGIFLCVSVLRTFFRLKLKYILLGGYILMFAMGVGLAFFNPDFLALSFDSGGVTTGPITVPFLLAMGVGLAAVRSGEHSGDDSFGMVGLCSVGPIIAVMLMGFLKLDITPDLSMPAIGGGGIWGEFAGGFIHSLSEVGLALAPIVIVFFLFQLLFLRLPARQVLRIVMGVVYTYVGLVVFLTGVNVGFMPLGKLLGGELVKKAYKWLLLPVGMVMGALIVLAEPAVHVLNKQVEEVTGGAIAKRIMLAALCAGIAVAVGLAFLRVLTGIHIFWFLVPVYALSLALMFFVPPIFTGIAFDSGGVASGPMTATFLLPMAVGAVKALGETAGLTGGALGASVFADAYGLVAFVAMIPLITVQCVGLVFKIKLRQAERRARFGEIGGAGVVDFDLDGTPPAAELVELIELENSGDTIDFDEPDSERQEEEPKNV